MKLECICGRSVEAPEKAVGRIVTCPHCKKRRRVTPIGLIEPSNESDYEPSPEMGSEPEQDITQDDPNDLQLECTCGKMVCVSEQAVDKGANITCPYCQEERWPTLLGLIEPLGELAAEAPSRARGKTTRPSQGSPLVERKVSTRRRVGLILITVFLAAVGLLVVLAKVESNNIKYMEDNERRAASALEDIVNAQGIYRRKKGTYASSLKALSDIGGLDNSITDNEENYFGYTLMILHPEEMGIDKWKFGIGATPLEYGRTGQFSFYGNSWGSISFTDLGRSANSGDWPEAGNTPRLSGDWSHWSHITD